MHTYFEPILPDYGFDAKASPPWLMVPFNDFAALNLINGGGFTVTSLLPAIAVCEEDTTTFYLGRNGAKVPVVRKPEKRLFRIRGNLPGKAHIQVKNGHRVVTYLEVVVRPRVTLSIALNFIQGKSNGARVRSNHEIEEMIAGLNLIYNPQTNIHFELKKAGPVVYDYDFGDSVNEKIDQYGRPLKGHELNIITAKRDKDADINVFFAWRLQYTRANVELMGLAPFNGRNCYVRDSDPDIEVLNTLTHEISHLLGILDLTRRKKVFDPDTHRMESVLVNKNYMLADGASWFIPKHHANIMWSIARQIAGKTK